LSSNGTLNNPKKRVGLKRIFLETQEEYSLSSKHQFSKFTGIPITTITRYTNLSNHPVMSPVLGLIYIIDETKPMSKLGPIFSPTSGYHKAITGIDLNKLEPGKVYAFLPDKKTIYGVYKSARNARSILVPTKDPKYVRRYVNVERLVKISPTLSLYFCKFIKTN